MKIKRGTSRMIDTGNVLAAIEELRLQDEMLREKGWKLKPTARAYARKDGSLSIRVVWTSREPGLSCTFTAAVRMTA